MPPPSAPAGAKPRSVRQGGGGRAASKRRGGRRSRGQSPNDVRYFVGRPASGDAKPTLEQEVASEPEALVIAFKNDSLVYFVSEYRVTQRIEGGEVRLEREPAAAAQRVSTTNAS
jgi:hypothetical protein